MPAAASPISIHDARALEALRHEARLDPECVRRLRNAFYKHGQAWSCALEVLPADSRAAVSRRVAASFLALQTTSVSTDGEATKLLFEAQDGARFEAVLMRPRTGRVSVCLSCQSGCACGCRFCATGRMRAARDLSRDEILDQVVQARAVAGRGATRIRNVVFMGMGEPSHNPDVRDALAVLLDRRCFALTPRRVLVSTVGTPGFLPELARGFPGIALALSLHTVDPALRCEWMPVARSIPLASLRDDLAQAAALPGPAVMIEVLLVRDRNDAVAAARDLAAFLEGLDVYVNLLEVNPVPQAPEFRPTTVSRRRAFARELEAHGLKVTARHSFGTGINAGCGQLAGR